MMGFVLYPSYELGSHGWQGRKASLCYRRMLCPISQSRRPWAATIHLRTADAHTRNGRVSIVPHWGNIMPDPVAAQNLFDALKAFTTPPAAQSWYYSVAKDFQALGAGVFALIAAWAAYRGVMKRIAFDRSVAEERIAFDKQIAANERKAARRDLESQKYGMFLRLRHEVRRMSQDVDLILMKLEETIRTKKIQLERLGPEELLRDAKADYVQWGDGLSSGEYGLSLGDYNELEEAWRNIHLFSLSNIFLLDNLRMGVDDARKKETWCLSDLDEDGRVSLISMKLYRDACRDVQRGAKLLVDGLKMPIKELAALAGFEDEADPPYRTSLDRRS